LIYNIEIRTDDPNNFVNTTDKLSAEISNSVANTLQYNLTPLIKTRSKIKHRTSKYMVVYRHQNSEQNHNLLAAKKSFENVTKVEVFRKSSNKSKLHV